MAEEKILDNEILDDTELEGVAGGIIQETFADRTQLTQLGLYTFDKNKGFVGSVQDGFSKLGKKMGSTINVKCDSSLNNGTANVYQIDNQQVTRDEFWSIINEGIAANK